MANTYSFIGSTTLGSATASVIFSSIPQGFNNLVIHISANCTGSGLSISQFLRYNNTSYTIQGGTMYMTDSSAISGYAPSGATFVTPGSNYASSLKNNYIIEIFNYNISSRKVSLIHGGFAPDSTSTNAGWTEIGGNAIDSDQAAITQIEFYTGTANFGANSTFSLYGIKNT
jgi:hypothetical protein